MSHTRLIGVCCLLMLICSLVAVPASAMTTTVSASNFGYFSKASDGATWATLHDSLTSGAPGVDRWRVHIQSNVTVKPDGTFYDITRGTTTYNKSVMPIETITNASVHFQTWQTVINQFNGNIDIVSFDPGNSINYATTDYNKTKWGETVLGTIPLTSIAGSKGYTVYLNDAGLSYLNSATGDIVLGFRSSYDTTNTTPTWSPNKQILLYSTTVLADNNMTLVNETPAVPSASFSMSPTVGAAPVEVTFTDTTTGVPTNWFWDFGDGNTTSNTVRNPKHLYETAGTYEIDFKATNGLGSDWYNISFTVDPVSLTRTYPVSRPTNLSFGRIMPTVDSNLEPASTTIPQVNITPDEKGIFSFAIKANQTVFDMTVNSSALSDGLGHTIPKANVDIRGVKPWWEPNNNTVQSTDSWYRPATGYYLTPRHILKDLNLINVSIVNQNQTLRVTQSGVVGYIDISNRSKGLFPLDANIYDNATAEGDMQPFTLNESYNQQIWGTVTADPGQVPGTYTGTVVVRATGIDPITLNLTVLVKPIGHSPPVMDYDMYYLTGIYGTDTASWRADNNSMGNSAAYPFRTIKPATIFAAELKDMTDHGINHVLSYQDFSEDNTTIIYNNFSRMLQYWNASNLKKDKFYAMRFSSYITGVYTPIEGILPNLSILKNQTSTYGAGKVCIYGKDEPASGDIATMKPTMFAAYNNGSCTITASYTATRLDNAASFLSTGILGYVSSSDMSTLRVNNPAILLTKYNLPQSGGYSQEIYRKNYGYILWNEGFDGATLYAYQKGYGQSFWNQDDTDNGASRFLTEAFAWPKTDGVIDTIQYEALREGITDVRRAEALSYLDGNKTRASSIIASGITNGLDMISIRTNIEDTIEGAENNSVNVPIVDFSANVTSGSSPLAVSFTSTSTNATGWNWSFGDGTLSTDENPEHMFTTMGDHTITVNATNQDIWYNITRKINYIQIIVVYPYQFINGGFEWNNLTGWTASGGGTASVTSSIKHSGGYAGFIHGSYGTTESLSQSVNVTGNGTLSFWYYPYDIAPNVGNKSVSVDGTVYYLNNNTATWAQKNIDISALSGVHTFTFTASSSGVGGESNLLIDDAIVTGAVAPVAAFTKSRSITIIPQPVTVTDTSTNVPTSWQWQWGDGTANGTLQNDNHSYATLGAKTINLEACNAAGCSDTAQTVTVVADGISGLTGTATSDTSITWAWMNPAWEGFNTTDVWRNNVFYANYTNSTAGVQWNGLTPYTEYTFSARTHSLDNNVMGTTWVNATVVSNPKIKPTAPDAQTSFLPIAFAAIMLVIFAIIGLLYMVMKGMKQGNKEAGGDFLQIVAVLVVLAFFVLLAIMIAPVLMF